VSLNNFDGLGWLLLVFLPFLWVQRWLHREIQVVFLLITRRPTLSIGLFSLLFFPGVLLHETSHFMTAHLLGVPTGRFSLLPKPLPDGKLQLGYVEAVRTDVLRDALIGLAPLLAGTLAIYLLEFIGLHLIPLHQYLNQREWTIFWQALVRLPVQPDFWLWFYLAFTISSTMLPSASDRQSWLPFLMFLALLVGLAFLAGVGTWMLNNLAPILNRILMALATAVGISLCLHIALIPPVGLLRVALSRFLKLEVV
jgi:hypothetical protein